MKSLVAFFSATGRTAGYASALAERISADLFEIRPEIPYTPSDLRWTNPIARCNREKIGKKDVPVSGCVENWDQYDTVFLGFPIWYYAAPNVVNTFCKGYDWTGKKLVLFATSGGSEIGKTGEKLLPYLNGSPELISAGVFRSQDDLIAAAERIL